MTQYQINSIKSSKETSQKLLKKELSYSEHLQNQKMIAMHKCHIEKMDSMLKELNAIF